MTPLSTDPPTPAAPPWQGRRVLVTGGLGFIGSNLARRLCDLGAEVTVLDSLMPQYGGNRFNLEGYRERIHVNLSDLRDCSSLEALLEGQELIFNLAGQTSHLDSMHDPETDLAINVTAQLRLLETCRRTAPQVRLIYASTRQLYGRPLRLPVDESHPIDPVDVNGINKLSAEMYHLLYARVYGLSACVLRLTNTIGPRMRIRDARQTFVGIWVRQLLEGRPIEVWGGEQLRDFNDVEDVVDAMLLAAEDRSLPLVPYNLGSTEVISLIDLARRMIALNGSGDLTVMAYPEERKKIDIGDYYSCFQRFQAACGWQPQRDLSDCLERTLAYYRQHLDRYI
ncbi:MAG: NAD-dependent epimerase/dehydratase family protein [Cyanobacteriota bacterium]|nr:NAD-dependent epimerase/dehydratase family protein [Cyanobacteriota bacterium]